MPDTLVGLVIFIALLTPGTSYAFRREANAPVGGRLSPVRETARLVSVSLISDLASLGLLSVLHALRVDDTPDPSVALSDASGFYRRSPLYALAWGAVFLGVACLLALFFATVVEAGWFTRLARWRRLAWLLRRSVSARSAWWEAFSG